MWVEVLCLIDRVWSSKEYARCACDPQCASEYSFHRFCLCLSMSEVISSFKSLRAGAQVFALIMLFFLVILQIMWSGELFGILCLSAIRMMFVKIRLAVCMLVCIVV